MLIQKGYGGKDTYVTYNDETGKKIGYRTRVPTLARHEEDRRLNSSSVDSSSAFAKFFSFSSGGASSSACASSHPPRTKEDQ